MAKENLKKPENIPLVDPWFDLIENWTGVKNPWFCEISVFDTNPFYCGRDVIERTLNETSHHLVVIPTTDIYELDNKKDEAPQPREMALFFKEKGYTMLDKESLQKDAPNQQKVCFFAASQQYFDLVARRMRGSRSKDDYWIIATALQLQKMFPDRPVTIITNDNYLHVEAVIMGCKAEPFMNSMAQNAEKMFSGPQTYPISTRALRTLGEPKQKYSVNELPKQLRKKLSGIGINQYFFLKCGTETHAARMVSDDEFILIDCKPGGHNSIYGIKPKNLEQACAMDMLLNPEGKLKFLTGAPGSGKTLIAQICALYLKQSCGDPKATTLYTRPLATVGDDYGSLPGDLEAKMDPYLGPLYDAIGLIMEEEHSSGSGQAASPKKKKKLKNQQNSKDSTASKPDNIPYGDSKVKTWMASHGISILPIPYVRGRTLRYYVIIDEAQNLTLYILETLITRIGEGCICVVMGDPSQCDIPHLGPLSNGLVRMLSNYYDSGPHHTWAHIHLTSTVRSEVVDHYLRKVKSPRRGSISKY